MEELLKQLPNLIERRHVEAGLTAALVLLVGFFVAKRAAMAVDRFPNFDIQRRLLFKRITYYGLAILTVAIALQQMGFDLKVLLGAAGVLTIAIGFAAQTSTSNLISGIFLMVERPFVIGDIIEVSGITGEVVAIDLLSSRIRTFDNRLVRVPNETLVKSNIINLSVLPIRRFDLNVGVAYGSDLKKVHQVLMRVARECPVCLQKPDPIIIWQAFADSSINLTFAVWALNANLLALRNDMITRVHTAFEQEGIEIPFPHRTYVLPPEQKDGAKQVTDSVGPLGKNA